MSHARLLRRAVLVVSLLTLTGLHVQQERPAAGWRVVRLLPLTMCLISAVANTINTVSVADSAPAVLYSLTMGLFTYHTLLLLVHLLRRRRHLHDLLRRAAALEEATAAQSRPGDHTALRLQTVTTCGLLISASTLGTASFLSQESLSHPKYPIPVAVPPALQAPPGYWVITVLQVLLTVALAGTTLVFELLFAGLADAVALFQTRLERYCQEHIGRRSEALDDVNGNVSERQPPDHHQVGDAEKGWLSSNTGSVGPLSKAGLWIMDELRPRVRPVTSPSPIWEPPLGCPEWSPELERHLSHLRTTHLSVSRLAADAAAFCSLPALSLYSCVTTNILLHSYISVNLFGSDAQFSGRANTLPLGSVSATLRLLTASCAGSRLLSSGQQLHQTLTEAGWPDQTPQTGRLALHLLLERTRRPPAFDVWGLFVVEKRNILSLLSFVLTYFVIMMQMNVG
ncbi:hypothetical protein FJT64_021444 [Amphibalanus amphitrite]|uniref:Odorant receptor n=1 Tax=Amphibalanus amphitrite TaxID=1232801 RepID=A0A6A4WXL5_AMPAM|nr:hypothetical protein FJT64_021444 [Amphibalanus amphitrite]